MHHLSWGQEGSVHCPECGQSFLRKDLVINLLADLKAASGSYNSAMFSLFFLLKVIEGACNNCCSDHPSRCGLTTMDSIKGG